MKTVLSNDGTSIAYDQNGNGPALILVDGALCHRAFGPSGKLIPFLTDHFTVYSYDRRGRGDSTDTKPYAVQREVEDLEAILEVAGGKAFVFGVSSGAALSLEAANHLKGIKRVVLYEAPFIVDNSTVPRPDDLEERMEQLIRENKRSEAVKLFMKTVGTPTFLIFVMRLMPMWHKLKAVAHTLPYDFKILEGTGAGNPLPKDRWAKAKMPILSIGGGASPEWMQNAMKELAKVLPHAEHRTLEGQTHMLKPEVIAPVLIKFFKS